MFLDSSALVAMLVPEGDGHRLAAELQSSSDPVTTPMAVVESVLGLRKHRAAPLSELAVEVTEFLIRGGVTVLEIPEDIHFGVLMAYERYGKGSQHPARLNLGDCFSYAMAKRLGIPLLYKGNDFARTDLA
ncbi:type II toxin-antitoxin system VapC family toxin [Aquibium sp. LZ166]|uniref:Ribonuclease VapC n=1 Tax=Aquibium pacificus TaxID=3153579 RepID=A0ABV3SKB5_9HYPH